MKFSKAQEKALSLLRSIQNEHKKDIWLRYVNDYWRVCPCTINDDNKTMTVHAIEKVNQRTWESLEGKGLIVREESPFIPENCRSRELGYVYKF